MAQSQNSTVDLATPATCLMGLTSHGNVMVGNKAFEYYNERNGHFTFSTRDDKETLRAVRKYVDENKLVRSPDFIDVTAKGAKSIPSVIKGLFHKGN